MDWDDWDSDPTSDRAAADVLGAYQAAKRARLPLSVCFRVGIAAWCRVHPDQSPEYAARQAVAVILEAKARFPGTNLTDNRLPARLHPGIAARQHFWELVEDEPGALPKPWLAYFRAGVDAELSSRLPCGPTQAGDGPELAVCWDHID